MRPRMADPRIRIFYQGVSDFRNGDSGLKNIYYAQRWRLEPSDETAFRMGRLVEPKKPIVFTWIMLFGKLEKVYQGRGRGVEGCIREDRF